MREGTTYVYRALHDISAGEELCHSYIDLCQSTNQRRTELENNYGFLCTCQRCDSDDVMADPFLERYVCQKYGCGGLYLRRGEFYACHKCGEEREDE